MLTTPPRVQVADTWHNTTWAPAGVTGEDVDTGGKSMSVHEMAYWRWRVESDGDVQIARLLVAGTAVTSPGAAVVVAQGVHRPLLEVADTPEVFRRSTGPFTVTG